MDQRVRSCTNCGTEWNDEIGGLQRAREFCPVCHLRLTGSSDTTPSNDDFTSQLRRLIEDARADGIGVERLEAILRDELAFVAELAHPDRRYYVQVIDIGPSEGLSMHIPPHEARQVLQRRSA
jgi:hypothetical protein